MEIFNTHFEIKETTFGNRVNVTLPNDADMLILCRNNGSGLVPFSLCLPGQVYEDKIRKQIEQFPDTKEIVAIPVRSSEKVAVFQKV